MSYDLLAFDPQAAPRDPSAFKDWWAVQSQWGEGHSYDDPDITTPELRDWYLQMVKRFPDIGALTDDEDIGEATSDYSIGKHIIYVAFPWAIAEEAYDSFREAVVTCNVGFYEVSTDQGTEELYFPDGTLLPPSNGSWRAVSRQFQQSQSPPAPIKRRWLDIFRRK